MKSSRSYASVGVTTQSGHDLGGGSEVGNVESMVCRFIQPLNCILWSCMFTASICVCICFFVRTCITAVTFTRRGCYHQAVGTRTHRQHIDAHCNELQYSRIVVACSDRNMTVLYATKYKCTPTGTMVNTSVLGQAIECGTNVVPQEPPIFRNANPF